MGGAPGMRCSCAALAALNQALAEALERGTSPDGRRIGRNICEALHERSQSLYYTSLARCASESGVTCNDIEDCLEFFVDLGCCVRHTTP